MLYTLILVSAFYHHLWHYAQCLVAIQGATALCCATPGILTMLQGGERESVCVYVRACARAHV